MTASSGPAESVLLATVARRYYLHGDSKKDIADQLGINRFKVARLLETALESGLVRIEIATVGGVDLDTSAQLQERLGLRRCVVLARSTKTDFDATIALGIVAADVLSEVLMDSDILGLPWSRAIVAMTNEFRQLPAVRVVQLSGAMEIPGINASAVDIVRETARVSGAESVIFHAPFILDSVASARAIRRQPSVREGLAAVSTVTHAVVGLGQWSPGLSTLYEMATEKEHRTLADAGVLGETAGVFFDGQGQPVQCEMTDRMITLSGRDLSAIPSVTAIVQGAAKAPATLAAIRGGLIDGLITDAELAAAVMDGSAAAESSMCEN